jgi:hypothetical protein
MMTPTLTAGASARADEMTEGDASKAAVPESTARRFISIIPAEFFLDILILPNVLFSKKAAFTLPHGKPAVYRPFVMISTMA